MYFANEKIVYVCYNQEKLNLAREILDRHMIAYRFQIFNPGGEEMRPFENENIYYEIKVSREDYVRARYLLREI